MREREKKKEKRGNGEKQRRNVRDSKMEGEKQSWSVLGSCSAGAEGGMRALIQSLKSPPGQKETARNAASLVSQSYVDKAVPVTGPERFRGDLSALPQEGSMLGQARAGPSHGCLRNASAGLLPCS